MKKLLSSVFPLFLLAQPLSAGVTTNALLQIDAPTVWAGVTNIYTNTVVAGAINADFTLDRRAYVRLAGGSFDGDSEKNTNGHFYLGTNRNDVTLAVKGNAIFCGSYRYSTSPAAWVAAGVDPGPGKLRKNGSPARSFIKVHAGLPDGEEGSTGRVHLRPQTSVNGIYGSNDLGCLWLHRLAVEPSVTPDDSGRVEILDIPAGVVADIGTIIVNHAKPVGIAFRGGELHRNNSTYSDSAPFTVPAGRTLILEGVDGHDVYLSKRFNESYLNTDTAGGEIVVRGQDVRFCSYGEVMAGVNGYNYFPWKLRRSDHVRWQHGGNLKLDNLVWLRCEDDDVLPAASANGDIVLVCRTDANHAPGNANGYLGYSCIDLYGTTQHVNGVTSTCNAADWQQGVVTNSTPARSGTLVLGARGNDCTFNARCTVGTELLKEGAGTLTLKSASGPRLTVAGGRVVGAFANPAISNAFATVTVAAGAALEGSFIVRERLAVQGAAGEFPALNLALAPNAQIVPDRENVRLILSSLCVAGQYLPVGTYSAQDVAWLAAGEVVVLAAPGESVDRTWPAGAAEVADPVTVRWTPLVWTAGKGAAVTVSGDISSSGLVDPFLLVGPGTFTLAGDNAGLQAPLAATNAAKVVAETDTALGAASRPFTLYCGETGNSTTTRYLAFAGDRTMATPICVKDVTGPLNDAGATLTLTGTLSAWGGGTHAIGVNANSRLVLAGGLDATACDRFFINQMGGAETIVSNRPLVASSTKANEFDINTLGSVSAESAPVFTLAAPGNVWRLLRVFGGRVQCAAPNVLAADGWIRFGRSDWTPHGDPALMTLDLGGHDQRCGGLGTDWFVADATGKSYNPARHAAVTSPSPATLTIKPVYGHSGEGGVIYAAVKFTGAAALVFAPGGTANALTLANQLSDTTGDLRVSSGTLTLAQGAGWTGATNVSVTGTGTLAIDAASSAAAFGADGARTTLHLDGQGRLAIPAGCTVTVHNVVFDGVRALPGTYGGTLSGAEDCSHAVHFAPGGGVLKAVHCAESVPFAPENSQLFYAHVDDVSGVKSYILKPNLVDAHHQSFYFTARSMTDDGRFLFFNAMTNEYWYGKSPTRRNAYIDFKTDTVHVFTNATFYSPWLDVERDQLWFVDKTGVHRRDLLVDPDADILVCPLPPELAYESGKSYSYGTHITLSPDRTLIFMDARTDQIFREGCIDVTTGRWKEWGQCRFCCNHGQSSPTDPHLAMCAWEYATSLVLDELTPEEQAAAEMQNLPYTTWTPRPKGHLYPRLWLFRDDCAPWMVREKFVNNASHEIFRPDGRGIYWCASGVTQLDFDTGLESRIAPVGAAHATMTRDGACLVFDQSVNGWWRGCDWTVRFWNRNAHRSCYIHNFMSRIAEKDNESKLHPDPHPQFVCRDRYVVCTGYVGDGSRSVNDRCMCLSVTPVDQLVALTEAMAESNTAKRIEVKGWQPGIADGAPLEMDVDTRKIEAELKKSGRALYQPQVPGNSYEFTSYALEAVAGGKTNQVAFTPIQRPDDFRYGATLRFRPPTGAEKLLVVVDPPGRYEVQESELCDNLFDRRDIRDFYPRTAAPAFAPGASPVAAASCAVSAAAAGPVRFELDVLNFGLSPWWGNIRLEQFDAAGNPLGGVFVGTNGWEDVGLVRDQRFTARKFGTLDARTARVDLYFEGVVEDGSAPKLQLQNLNLRPARAIAWNAPPPSPPATTGQTLVVTVAAGSTNTLTTAQIQGLVNNVYTNFVKRGGGTLTVGTNLSRYLGDIHVEEGTYQFTTNTALGKLAGEKVCGSVHVYAGAALDACPPATATGEAWGSFNKRILFEGAGPDGRGALVHSGMGRLTRLHFSSNLVMTADAAIGNVGRYPLFQNGSSPIFLTMRGHTLALLGDGEVLGRVNIRWPGRIVVSEANTVTLMSAGMCLGGTAANELVLEKNSTLRFNKTAGNMCWTLDATAAPAGLEVIDGTAGAVSTNLSYWEGPVLTGGQKLPLGLGSYDFTFQGPISGAGLTATGNAAAHGRLHLVSPANSFTGGLSAENVDVYLWHAGALPASGGMLAITNGAVHLMDASSHLALPSLMVDGAGAIFGEGYGQWREVVKTGLGALDWPTMVGAARLEVKGGCVGLGYDFSRRTIAGLVESGRRDFDADHVSQLMSEMRTQMLVHTNATALSPAAYYDHNHHLWTDPTPSSELYRSFFSYSGYIWSAAETNETWSFAGAANTHLFVTVNGTRVFYYSDVNSPSYGSVTVHPGPNTFDVRGYTTAAGRAANVPRTVNITWPEADFMVGYDPLGRNSSNQKDYQKIIDPGDGSLLTWCLPEEVVDGATVPPGKTEPIVRQAVFGEMHFAPGTGLNVTGEAYCVATLTGLPVIRGGVIETGLPNQSSIPHSEFRIQHWIVPLAEVAQGGRLTTEGRLELGEVELIDATGIFRGRQCIPVATAAIGIVLKKNEPQMGVCAEWTLELSADGKTLYAKRRPRGGLITVW